MYVWQVIPNLSRSVGNHLPPCHSQKCKSACVAGVSLFTRLFFAVSHPLYIFLSQSTPLIRRHLSSSHLSSIIKMNTQSSSKPSTATPALIFSNPAQRALITKCNSNIPPMSLHSQPSPPDHEPKSQQSAHLRGGSGGGFMTVVGWIMCLQCCECCCELPCVWRD